MQGEVGTHSVWVCKCVCVLGGLIGTLACWTAGVWNRCHRSCLALLIKRKQNSFYVHTNTPTFTHTYTLGILLKSVWAFALIYVNSHPSFWNGLLDSALHLSGQLLFWPLTHVQTCPVSLSIYLPLIKDCLFFFTSTLLFTQYLRPQCLFSTMCLCVLVQ